MTKIIAHRGASKFAPENTMPAFELAYEMKAEGIETDVHLTKDKIPVLIHDEHVKRTTNCSGFIRDYNFSELQHFDAGSWFSSKYAGTSIISLQEFLEWAMDKPLDLNIELKNSKIDYKNMEAIVYEMVDHYQLLNRTTLSTFNPVSVQRLKFLNKKIGVALLHSRKRKDLIVYAKNLGANAIHINYRLLRKSLVQQCKQEDMTIRVYTVNKFVPIMRSFYLECDGIFTDVPNKALRYRSIL
ncbi:glycerophosphodiester phosphodiesterase [Oceanobacillus saliphilus]|uniref:glycerophosphodiester phosphodiesterase n=1 Tax=Oceanobacillus saliphilus TaxID=2925834 RepID=UPI00201E4A79|nr:glycerophosphodiester phosphodiesterase family protein [Oceanobacillus saliphilus]